MDTIAVRFEFADETIAEETADDLERVGAQIKSRPKRGIVPIIPIVIGVVIGVAALATIVTRIINGRKCRMIIDARSSEITTRVDCAIKDGRLIVFTNEGEKVSIIDAPPALDIAALISTATKGTADEIKKLAGQGGAKVELA